MDDIKEDTTSRGIIVKDFLLSDDNPRKYLAELQKKDEQFNGFNLIAGFFYDLYYVSNKTEGVYKINPGIHSISNAFLNTSWPKTKQASGSFKKILDEEGPDEEKLFTMLQNDKRYPVEELPDTGLPKETERAVSSVFIETENYGTRSSTIVAVDNEKNVHFAERTYIPGSKKSDKTVGFDFKV